jgi:hypothetical protein
MRSICASPYIRRAGNVGALLSVNLREGEAGEQKGRRKLGRYE